MEISIDKMVGQASTWAGMENNLPDMLVSHYPVKISNNLNGGAEMKQAELKKLVKAAIDRSNKR